MSNTVQLIFALSLLLFLSCETTSQKDKVKTTRAEKIKLKQYLNEGKRLFDIHCSNCHQTDGSGLARLYPPLRNADYLKGGFDRVICQIRYGVDGEMAVNGIVYNMPMPAKPELTILEIAEISTYVFNKWGDNKGIISTERVSETLKTCSLGP